MELPIRTLIVAGCLSVAATSLFGVEPIHVGDRTCLFLDDHFIAEQSGLKRVWHQGQPRAEVAIKAERENPWEKWPDMFGSAIAANDGDFPRYSVVTEYAADSNRLAREVSPTISRGVFDRLPAAAQPLFRHWIRNR